MNQCEKVSTTSHYQKSPHIQWQLVEETQNEQTIDRGECEGTGADKGPDTENKEGEIDEEGEDAEDVVDLQSCFVEVDQRTGGRNSHYEENLEEWNGLELVQYCISHYLVSLEQG